MYPKNLKDAAKKMPRKSKIDLAIVLIDAVLKREISGKEEELRNEEIRK